MKKVKLCLLLFIAVVILCFSAQNQKKTVWMYYEGDSLKLCLKDNVGEEVIVPWYNSRDAVCYFFLPSYVKNEKVYLQDNNIEIDENVKTDKNSFEWQEENIYRVSVCSEGEGREYEVRFMKSENLPAVFVNTESGNMDYIHENKENEEAGAIKVVNASGAAEYRGNINAISGRGNSTWYYDKKPYAIELANATSLCGMDKGKRWNLLALWEESSRINSKIVYDIATELGMQYSVQGEWVDLFINGSYEGLYLLTETVSVGEGRVEIEDLEEKNKRNNPLIDEAAWSEKDGIKGYDLADGVDVSGGYIIEKKWSAFYEFERTGFITERNHCFSVKAPKHASVEQVKYISDFCQKVEDAIASGKYEEYIDVESFVNKFLVEEISLNYDANIGSTFFYKDADEEVIYAGPVWDYDGTFGTKNEDYLEGKYIDHTWTTLTPRLENGDVISWFNDLYEDENFYRMVCERYAELLPFLQDIVDNRIEEYAAWIKESEEMNRVRWSQNSVGYYTQYDNNLKYIKYFMINRLKYLCERWNVPYSGTEVENNSEMHQIILKKDDAILETICIEDGAFLTELPELDKDLYKGWYFESAGMYREQIPIYEDVILYAK